jgi:hypothetical protein
MSKLNKAVAALARKDIGFRRTLQAALGLPVPEAKSPLLAKMAAGMKVAKGVKETMNAYSDAQENNPADRTLMFRATKWMTVKQWTALMVNAIPNGYNAFSAKKVGRWLATIERKVGAGPLQMQPAREYSVCAYIRGPRETLEAIIKSGRRRGGSADEAGWERGKEGEEVRLWWD